MKLTTIQWLLIGLATLVLALFVWRSTVTTEGFAQTIGGPELGLNGRFIGHEGFVTTDPDTLKAQRQQLQMEGERRYNPVARLQAPAQKISAGAMDAALTTARAAPALGNPAAASLLGLIGSSLGLGAADDGSGKVGNWVEQTGVVQDKINFCESLTTIDCDRLQNDPRMKECGFCHRDGLDSTGKAHRGGMYISADDQIRANEEAAGGAASYQPTIGTCAPKNFTLMASNCKVREAELQCQSAGAPTSNNPCAQCYGSTPRNATGLMYFTPSKPFRHQVFLNVSHPGYYTGPNGYGLEVTYPNGAKTGVSAVPAGTNDQVVPVSGLALNLAEGDIITITVYGPPSVWCGWLSNQSGTRTVSLDVGMQSMQPEGGMEIAGDKNAGPVKSAVTSSSAWPAFQSSIPNTVLWYLRRSDNVAPSLVQALYGNLIASAADVTGAVQMAAGKNQDLPVNPALLGGQSDPAPGQAKTVFASFDTGYATSYVDGVTMDWSQWTTKVTFTFQMPATLADPPLADDLADCPTGPIVMTEVGAGLMGSHSCFKADGSFNPNAYCLQELFTAAGGTRQGTDWPATDAAAAKLVAPSGTLDDTVAALNRLGNIAIYGVDMNGAQVDFPTFKDAALRMLGIAVKNPCDGPMSATGPHSAECLDYLWRTMNNPGQDAVPMTTVPPYSGCSAAGLSAPLNPDGSVNATNVAAANARGGVNGVRGYFQNLYYQTQNTSNFDDQVAAMRDCYGTNIQPPVAPAGSCPPPAPNDFQCITPEMIQAPEVFAVCGDNGTYSFEFKDAESTCASYGARLASPAEITAAQQSGAQWCSCAWASDGSAYYPMQQSLSGCGNPGVNSCNQMTNGWEAQPGKACVTCYGVKPPSGTTDVQSFSSATNTWSQVPFAGLTDQYILACRQNAGNVECLSDDGTNPHPFSSAQACQAPGAFNGIQSTMPLASQNGFLSGIISQYLYKRV
jgi:hypothetical protein